MGPTVHLLILFRPSRDGTFMNRTPDLSRPRHLQRLQRDDPWGRYTIQNYGVDRERHAWVLGTRDKVVVFHHTLCFLDQMTPEKVNMGSEVLLSGCAPFSPRLFATYTTQVHSLTTTWGSKTISGRAGQHSILVTTVTIIPRPARVSTADSPK